MSRSKIIAGIEIGTSKVTVLLGEVVDGRRLNIIGTGQSTSMGIRKGEIFDISSASDCTHAAILSAEKKAEAQIEEAYISQTGAHLQGFSHPGITTISATDGTVSGVDIRRAVDNAKSKNLPLGRIYIHHIRSGYLLDGELAEKPLNMQGKQLEAQYWHVHGDERRVKNCLDVVQGIGVRVEDIVVSSLASGTILTTETEKQHGVLVVDIGSGTTDFVLYKGGRVVRTGVIPVGGDHITNDLSLGLRINPKRAESLKLRYGKAVIDKNDKGEQVMLVGDLMIGDQPIPRLAIYKIIHARVEELFMILKNKLGSALSRQNLAGGVILTGGVSQLPHIVEMAESTMGVNVRLGVSPEWVTEPELRKPEYSTVIGLLYYGLKGQQTEEDVPMEHRKVNMINKLAGIFK